MFHNLSFKTLTIKTKKLRNSMQQFVFINRLRNNFPPETSFGPNNFAFNPCHFWIETINMFPSLITNFIRIIIPKNIALNSKLFTYHFRCLNTVNQTKIKLYHFIYQQLLKDPFSIPTIKLYHRFLKANLPVYLSSI